MRRIETGLTGAQVVLPTVPRAAEDLSRPAVVVLADARRTEEAMGVARAQGATLVGTTVENGEELAVNVEDAYRSARDLDDLSVARRNFVNGGDDVFHRVRLSPFLAPTVILSLRRIRDSSADHEKRILRRASSG